MRPRPLLGGAVYLFGGGEASSVGARRSRRPGHRLREARRRSTSRSPTSAPSRSAAAPISSAATRVRSSRPRSSATSPTEAAHGRSAAAGDALCRSRGDRLDGLRRRWADDDGNDSRRLRDLAPRRRPAGGDPARAGGSRRTRRTRRHALPRRGRRVLAIDPASGRVSVAARLPAKLADPRPRLSGAGSSSPAAARTASGAARPS